MQRKMDAKYYIKIFVLMLIYFYTQCNGRNIFRSAWRRFTKEENTALQYLTKYGYYDSWVESRFSFVDALKVFQRFNHLNITGIADEDTLLKLKQRRCGVADSLSRGPMQRFYTHPTSWRNRNISWRLTEETKNNITLQELTKNDIRLVFKRAFEIWQNASHDLVFVETNDTHADIRIKFAHHFHADPFPFDGEGESIAHAFLPLNNRGLSGDIHLDDSEIYTLKSSNGTDGINLLWVALHEIGHSVGILHSSNPNSIMYPWYNRTHPILQLHKYDIDALRSVYPASQNLPMLEEPLIANLEVSNMLPPNESERKSKLYRKHYKSWINRTISWRLAKETKNDITLQELTKKDIHSVLETAFEIWQNASHDLMFVETNDTHADIQIKFVYHSHTRPYPAYRRSISNTFYLYNGKGLLRDIVFDDRKSYTLKSSNETSGIHLLWFALHEIGHSLGVSHSFDPNSIMYPWQNKAHPILQPQNYDIDAIRYLYPSDLKIEYDDIYL